jgi:hypothetical protein
MAQAFSSLWPNYTVSGRSRLHFVPAVTSITSRRCGSAYTLPLGREPEDKVMMLRTIIWVYGVLVLVGFYMGATPF